MGRLKEVLAFVNNKGGVGKTTTVQNVAAGLLRQNSRLHILCIDLDPQGNLSTLLGWREKSKKLSDKAYTIDVSLRNGDSDNTHLPVYKCRNGLFYIPASPMLSDIEPSLHRQMQSKMVLNFLFGNTVNYMEQLYPQDDSVTHKEKIDYIEDSFDYVLIDCAPALSELTYNALAAATGVIIPVELGSLSVDGIGRMLEACRNVKRRLNKELELYGLLAVKSDGRTNMARSTLDFLRNNYTTLIFKSVIRQCVKVGESQFEHQDIFSYAPECTAAQDYAAFVKELTSNK